MVFHRLRDWLKFQYDDSHALKFQQLRRPRDLARTVFLNAAVFAPTILGLHLMLDPEGADAPYSRDRELAGVLFLLLLPALLFVPDPIGILGVWLIVFSPGTATMFIKLDDRLLCSRWYFAMIGAALLLASASLWILIPLWAYQTWQRAHFWGSAHDYWNQAFDENPKPCSRRVHNKAWILFMAGNMDGAELEYERILTIDPQNVRAIAFLQTVKASRAMLAQNRYPVAFNCGECRFEHMGLFQPGERISKEEHAIFFLRQCPRCKKEVTDGKTWTETKTAQAAIAAN